MTQASPLVSFLVPTYRRSGWLPAAVESALAAAQGAPFGVEVVIIDDCSPDDTPEVCRRLESQFPAVRTVRLTENRGLAQARNAGIKAARGKYLALLDDDDLRLPGSLGAQVERLESNPDAAVCYAPVQVADAEMRLSGVLQPHPAPEGDLFWELLEENFIRVPSVVIRKASLLEVGLFDPGLRRVEGHDRWVRLAERFPFVAVQQPVAVYRQCNVASGQLSADHAAMARCATDLLEEWLELPRAIKAGEERISEVRRRFLEHRITVLRNTACQCLEAGMAGAARRDLLAAWQLDRGLALRHRLPRLWLRSWLPVPARKASAS